MKYTLPHLLFLALLVTASTTSSRAQSIFENENDTEQIESNNNLPKVTEDSAQGLTEEQAIAKEASRAREVMQRIIERMQAAEEEQLQTPVTDRGTSNQQGGVTPEEVTPDTVVPSVPKPADGTAQTPAVPAASPVTPSTRGRNTTRTSTRQPADTRSTNENASSPDAENQTNAAVDSSKTAEETAAKLELGHKAWNYYQPLLERNIFTRTTPGSNTRPVRNTQPTDTRPQAPKPPQPNWILTGVVINAQGNYAFFENSLTFVTLRVVAGETIGNSRVTHVASDRVVVSSNNDSHEVLVGTSLDGRDVTLGTPQGGSIFGEATPPVSNSPTGNSREAILERMRAKRLQESGK